MKFMFLIYRDENDEKRFDRLSPEDAKKAFAAWMTYTDELRKVGYMVAGDPLKPTATATTVRHQGGRATGTTDGPFAETKEQLGGYYLVDVPNLDVALQWAAKMPVRDGAVEVRPVAPIAPPSP